jgi:glutamate synthase (NADPH/NADH) small chain
MISTPQGGSLPAQRLELQLADAKPMYAPGDAVTEANRCLFCHDAPCVEACPTGIDIPGFIKKIATDNVRGSARTILSANLLGYSCARVCPVEVLCVGACVYNEWHRTPIQIGKLQRYAVEQTFRNGGGKDLLSRAPSNGRKVACVGAGPASLATAGYLALEGCAVTVFEQRPLAGGLNTTGVAPYKMHVDGALLEVDFIRSLGVEIRTGVDVGKDVTFEGLLRDYDAVFIGVGLGADSRLGIPGEDGPGVVGATEWIEHMKLDPKASVAGVRQALVIGGGNTAIDAARELARLGVPDVRMAYRRTAADMPGYAHEMEHARQEGVHHVERAVPEAMLRDSSGALVGMRLADGRELKADLVVLAIGQAKLAKGLSQLPGISLDAKGRLVIETPTGSTGHPKVFAGGDVSNGGELVVTAAQEGKRAARSICAALGLEVRPTSPMRAGHA